MKNKKIQSFIRLGLLSAILLIINILVTFFDGHLDLTEDKRYTLTAPTRRIVEGLKDPVTVKILLEGEFPAGFKRLQQAVKNMLNDLHNINPIIEYQFSNPLQGTKEQNQEQQKNLAEQGIYPTRLAIKDGDETSEKYIYPVAVLNLGERKQFVNLLENDAVGRSDEEVLNHSVELLEYKFASAIYRLVKNDKPNIIFTTGHGELAAEQTASLEGELRKFYDTGRINLDSLAALPAKDTAFGTVQADVVIVAKPTKPFSEKDKFKLDQYVMNGGRIIWLIDRMTGSLDSMMRTGSMLPTEYPLNLEDQLYRYGARIQPNLVVDLECSVIMLRVGQQGGQPQYDKLPWFYYPIASPQSNHSIVKNLDRVWLQFPASIDTIRTKTNVVKTPILSSSKYSRLQYSPTTLSFEILRDKPDVSKFNQGQQIMGLLLEGQFQSLYENRVPDEMLQLLTQLKMPYKAASEPTKMLVVADGDLARNDLNPAQQRIYPLGFSRDMQYTFANKDFLINSIEYMLSDAGFIEARTRFVKLRLLDTRKAKAEATTWKTLNLLVPILLVGLLGGIYFWRRKKRFAM